MDQQHQWISIVLTLLLLVLACKATTVKVEEGWLTGDIKPLRNGKIVHRFLGVPYALPPVGERRFRDPEPITPWLGTWNATNQDGSLVQCMQFIQVPGGPYVVGGQEDCLYLNVYTPQIPQAGEAKLYDVIVYIHGGAFMFGSGYHHQALTLLERYDVVYVSLNYRLGPLGFLSTGDRVVGGNMGLKDQTLALRWIRANIAQFGGNPNSVTIAGMSAGGASVHYQMLMPQAKGLFHKAISMSGTSLCPWTLAEQLPDKTKLIADHLGCPTHCSHAMVQCLKARPASLIVNAVKLTQGFLYNPFSPWGPSIDNHASDPVLPTPPVTLLKQGLVADVPWLASVVTAEGLYPAAEWIVSSEVMDHIDTLWNKLAPLILDFNHTVVDHLKQETAERIREEYLGKSSISVENFKLFVQLISDRMFNVDAERAARLQAAANRSPVYFYEFNYRGRYSLSDKYSRSKRDFGVSHGDDTQYVVQYNPLLLQDTTPEEERTIEFMTDLWASFARNGTPHIAWPRVQGPTSPTFPYLRVDKGDDYYKVEVPELGRRSFWESLPIEENRGWAGGDMDPTRGNIHSEL